MTAVAGTSTGVTPDVMTIFGVIVPLTRTFPAPDCAIPMEKCVAVLLPPVAIGKLTLFFGLTLDPVMVKPVPSRATATRAYPV